MYMIGLTTCDGCDGCGYVADTSTREPWIYHTEHLVDADGRPLFPEVKKVPCGKCKGTGRIPWSMVNKYRREKRRN